MSYVVLVRHKKTPKNKPAAQYSGVDEVMGMPGFLHMTFENGNFILIPTAQIDGVVGIDPANIQQQQEGGLVDQDGNPIAPSGDDDDSGAESQPED